MGDILCVYCKEPWDQDNLHDMPEEVTLSYEEKVKLFRKYGCGFFNYYQDVSRRTYDTKEVRKCIHGKERNEGIDIVYDLNDGDMDASASDLEDAELLGLLDD